MSDLILPGRNDPFLEQQILQRQLQAGDVVFANGAGANNHLDLGFEDIIDSPELVDRIANRTTLLIASCVPEPAFIATVPTGADGWGKVVAAKLRGPQGNKPSHLKFNKVDRRKFENTDEASGQIEKLLAQRTTGLQTPRPGVVLDDATSDGGTNEALADYLTEQGLVVDLVTSIFFRGKPEWLKSKYRRAAVFHRFIPYMLDWDTYRGTSEIKELITA